MDEPERAPKEVGRGALARLARHSALELILTFILLFGVTSIVRWVIGPSLISRAIPQIDSELLIVGAAVALLLAGLILSPPGKASGGPHESAISLAMWRFGVFPGAGVVPYTIAQLLGSVLGVLAARAGSGRGGAAGAVRRAPAGIRVVDRGAVRGRDPRHGRHRVHRRDVPRGAAPSAVGALGRRRPDRDGHRTAGHVHRGQREPGPPVRTGSRLWSGALPVGVSPRSDGGSSHRGMAAADDPAPPRRADPQGDGEPIRTDAGCPMSWPPMERPPGDLDGSLASVGRRGEGGDVDRPDALRRPTRRTGRWTSCSRS